MKICQKKTVEIEEAIFSTEYSHASVMCNDKEEGIHPNYIDLNETTVSDI